MDTRKPIERMNSYLRSLRPREFLEYDRLVRLMLRWFDTHRIKEPKVFFEKEGNEYAAFVGYLTSELGYTPVFPSPDFVSSLFTFSRETR
jgi:hypothetical protein